MKEIKNLPNLAGSLAARKELFGEWKRYAVYPVHTRFDAVQWFVADAFALDEAGMPEIIRQAATKEEAMKGVEK